MKNEKITINNFKFQPSGYGHYKVIYTSPSGKEFTKTIDNMPIIDATKNSDSPKTKDLNTLKRMVKNLS